jgi:hypothetical protein
MPQVLPGAHSMKDIPSALMRSAVAHRDSPARLWTSTAATSADAARPAAAGARAAPRERSAAEAERGADRYPCETRVAVLKRLRDGHDRREREDERGGEQPRPAPAAHPQGRRHAGRERDEKGPSPTRFPRGGCARPRPAGGRLARQLAARTVQPYPPPGVPRTAHLAAT